MDNIKYDIHTRNIIYSNLLKIYRSCFINESSILIPSKIFFRSFFIFLHNPVNHNLMENIDNDDLNKSFQVHFCKELNQLFPENENINLYIVSTVKKNFNLFTAFLFKRKTLIEGIAKKLWMICHDMDDVSMWINAESMVEKQLILSIDPENNKISKYGINLMCLTFDEKLNHFPKVLFQRI